MPAALCQPAVAFRDEGLSAVFWFVLLSILLLFFALLLLLCWHCIVPWYRERQAKTLPPALPTYYPWRPSSLKTATDTRRQSLPSSYPLPSRDIPHPSVPHQFSQPTVTFSPLPPPVVIIPPDVDLPSPTPMADRVSPYRTQHYAELSPVASSQQRIQPYHGDSSFPPTSYTLVRGNVGGGGDPYEAVAVRTTTTTRRTTVLSPIPPSRVTTIV